MKYIIPIFLFLLASCNQSTPPTATATDAPEACGEYRDTCVTYTGIGYLRISVADTSAYYYLPCRLGEPSKMIGVVESGETKCFPVLNDWRVTADTSVF